jgi:hypothetical protein
MEQQEEESGGVRRSARQGDGRLLCQPPRGRQVRGTTGDAGFGNYYLPGFCSNLPVVVKYAGQPEMLDLVNIIYPAFVQASRSRQVRGTAGDAGFGKYYLPGFCTSFP